MPKQLKIMTVSWWALVQTVGPFLLLNLAALAIWGTVHFMSAAPPPRTLTLSSGRPSSHAKAVIDPANRSLVRRLPETRARATAAAPRPSRTLPFHRFPPAPGPTP